nr:uncharacterized protein LOC106689842 [Halyomorpha halys]
MYHNAEKMFHSGEKMFLKEVIKSLRNLGALFFEISEIRRISKVKSGYKAFVTLKTGQKHYTGTYESVIIQQNRVPFIHSMGLEVASVEMHKRSRKIVVNSFYQSSNPRVWAFGCTTHGHPSHNNFEILAGKRIINLLTNERDIPVTNIYPFILMTPLQYVFCGETEKTAKHRYKNEKIVLNETQNGFFRIKIISIRKDHGRTEYNKRDDIAIGIHILGHNIWSLLVGLDKLISNGVTKYRLVRKLVTQERFREFRLNRISFKSRKFRNTYFGMKSRNEDSSGSNTDTSSLFIVTWSDKLLNDDDNPPNIVCGVLPIPTETTIIDETITKSLLTLLLPIVLSLGLCALNSDGARNEHINTFPSDYVSEGEESDFSVSCENVSDNGSAQGSLDGSRARFYISSSEEEEYKQNRPFVGTDWQNPQENQITSDDICVSSHPPQNLGVHPSNSDSEPNETTIKRPGRLNKKKNVRRHRRSNAHQVLKPSSLRPEESDSSTDRRPGPHVYRRLQSRPRRKYNREVTEDNGPNDVDSPPEQPSTSGVYARLLPSVYCSHSDTDDEPFSPYPQTDWDPKKYYNSSSEPDGDGSTTVGVNTEPLPPRPVTRRRYIKFSDSSEGSKND